MRYLTLFIALTGLTACGAGPVDRPPIPAQASLRDKTELKVGVEAFEEGRYNAARIQFERIVKEEGAPRVVAHARLYLGRLVSIKDPAAGALRLDALAGELPEGPHRTVARAYGAEAAARAGQCAQARAGAAAVEHEVGGAARADMKIALSRCYPPPTAFALIEDGARSAHAVKDQAALNRTRTAASAILPKLKADERADAQARSEGGPLADLFTGAPAVQPASPAMEAPSVTPGAVTPGITPDVTDPVSPPDQPVSGGAMAPSGPPHVALLLPLSGRSAPLGARIQGVADMVGDEDQPGDPTQVEVLDAGSPAKARAAMDSLRGRAISGVVAIFDQQTAEGVGGLLGELELPVIALTLSQAPMRSDRVWRGLHTPPLVARAVAGAGLAAGGRRAAIVYPDIAYGQALARLFEGSWQAGGGEITVQRSFSLEKPDIKAMARDLKGRGFDTLFLPAPPQVAANLLSHFAAEAGVWSKSSRRSMAGRKGVKEVVLLGIPEWYDQRLIDQAGRYVDGALIPVPFATELSNGAAFAGAYTARHNRVPTAFEALTYDAIQALAAAHEAARSTGQPVATALSGSRYAEGASVGFNFGDREAVQDLYVLEITPEGFSSARR